MPRIIKTKLTIAELTAKKLYESMMVWFNSCYAGAEGEDRMMGELEKKGYYYAETESIVDIDGVEYKAKLRLDITKT